MARKKHLARYPREYTLLFKMASERPVQIACDSPSQATSVRNDLYAFRSVLKDNANADTQTMKLAKLAFTVSLSIHDRTITAEPIERGK